MNSTKPYKSSSEMSPETARKVQRLFLGDMPEADPSVVNAPNPYLEQLPQQQDPMQDLAIAGGPERELAGKSPATEQDVESDYPDQIKKALSPVEEMLKKQDMANAANQELLKKYTEGGLESMDLSPLMAYTDSISGSKLAGSYKSPLDKLKAQMDLQNTANLGGGKGGQAMDALRLALTQGRAEQKWGQSFYDRFAADQEVKKIKENNQGAQEAMEVLKSGSYIGTPALRMKIARAMGAAPLSDVDVALMSGNPSLPAQAKRLFEKWTTGDMTPQDIADTEHLLNFLMQYSKNAMKQRQDYFVGLAPQYGLNPEAAREQLGMSWLGGKGGVNFDTNTFNDRAKGQAVIGEMINNKISHAAAKSKVKSAIQAPGNASKVNKILDEIK